MRRFLTLVFAVFMLVSVAAIAPARQPAPQQQTQTKEQTVYVTKTGKKYHPLPAGISPKARSPCR